MPIEFSCSNCFTSIRVPDDSAGKQAQCPACNSVSAVPTPFADQPSPSSANPFDSPQQPATVSPFGGGKIQLAERGTRLFAVLVDMAATIGPFALFGLMGVIIAASLDNDAGGVMCAICVVIGVIMMFGVAIYNMVLTMNTGETIGKRMMAIRIVKESDCSPPGFVHGVLLRSWVMILLSQVPFVGLIDVLMIFGDKRQCLHDMIASTRVVKGRPRSHARRTQYAAA